ncbi:MAG: universal stress protein [Solirubrobacteraceae bacterium]
MFKQIVVGVDEHEGGRDAIALGKRLLAREGELTLAYIYAGDPHVYRGASAASEASEREHALELLEQTREESGVQAHLRWRGSPSVGRGLHELCEVIGADLLVVGSSRRGLLGRVLIGDDTRAALDGAPCAIAVAPAGYAQQPVAMSEIGVAYNGSPESEHAILVAREIAAGCGAKLSAFEAVSLPTYAFVGGPAPIDDALDGLVDDARKRIADLGGVEPHAAYGLPVEELAVYSASLDLLIVGSRGYGPIGRVMHGSTSQQLAHTARCPLLVLPRAARAIEADEGAQASRDATVASKG